jgi:uncharacterized cupredoxin-like copper-binding protein
MALFTNRDRDALNAGTAALAVIALVLGLAGLITAAGTNDGGGGSSAKAGGVSVGLTEYAISPASLTVASDGKLCVTNNGTSTHNLSIDGTKLQTPDLAPGESATLDLSGLKDGVYTMFCAISGHRGAGMVGDLQIGKGGVAHAVNQARLLKENNSSDAMMKEPVDAYVKQLKDGANTDGVGTQKLDPILLADGTKEFDLTAQVTQWQVDPDTTVDAWTYNGMVPGPWIKVEPGDKVRIVLHNRLPQSTAIHFHGIETPNAKDGVPDVTQTPVKPGDDFTYEFVAKGPALGMYHSHHHAEHQVPDGLLGIFQVGDVALPQGMGPVTQEVPMVLNDAGAIGFSLNGKSFPATSPIIAHPGEWVEIHYFNEGMQIHPMHLHGIPQTVIAKDGFPLPNPYQVDTLNVAPGERYTVLVHPDASQLGVWAFHCHILTHAERDTGMYGMVTTFIVQ